MNPKTQKLERILGQIKPKSYYEELAEYGYLAKYIDEFAKIEYESDDEFREDILQILLKYSKDVIPELEDIYLSELGNALEEFFVRSGIEERESPVETVEAALRGDIAEQAGAENITDEEK